MYLKYKIKVKYFLYFEFIGIINFEILDILDI